MERRRTGGGIWLTEVWPRLRCSFNVHAIKYSKAKT